MPGIAPSQAAGRLLTPPITPRICPVCNRPAAILLLRLRSSVIMLYFSHTS